ncbi:hypothetical protein H5410_061902 [Solanum commersonii]|uniref:Uncharacterized protein n=1 Tax=Solanum commersonii TaxID=4109 RepID=A0A9J5WAM0_SOLCO|nr:hypothetical protein H5410_061902 [Solanum commersonii]
MLTIIASPKLQRIVNGGNEENGKNPKFSDREPLTLAITKDTELHIAIARPLSAIAEAKRGAHRKREPDDHDREGHRVDTSRLRAY